MHLKTLLLDIDMYIIGILFNHDISIESGNLASVMSILVASPSSAR